MSSSMKERVLVIGAGVSGLTTALCLRQKGFEVTVVAEKFAPHIVSVVAGALWEWPPAVCGHHLDQQSLERSKKWCMISYEKFFDLAQYEETGVFIRPVTFYFRYQVESNPRALRKMKEIERHVQGFCHSPALIKEHLVNEDLGLKDAYTHLTPMVNTDVYMHWLLHQVCKAGCFVFSQRIEGPLLEQERHLKQQFNARAIVNCSGLGSYELVDRSMYPLRGALVRVLNDGVSMPLLTEAHCVAHESGDEQDMIFIVPRGKDRVILGGLVEPGEWSTEISLENYPPIQAMFERCVAFLPALKQAHLDPQEPVRVGLRPARRENVRLEQEPGTSLIHNYGHGGSGVTFSWGCAQEVAERVEMLLNKET
ncbi:MAG: FAD-dependent oxidoreductase [Ktedonobacteraceae bacterium]|nr:FAD-dependent oxidoreductase [Ktedonobacteraceae bacterium]